jgi:hypothetical protein
MAAEATVFPKVIVKKKQVQQLVEFCLDESIEFSVKQQTFPDTDWEIELRLKDMRMAILIGMFMRENRLELDGIDPQRYKKAAAAKKADEKPEAPAKAEKVEAAKPKADKEESNPSSAPMFM